MSGKRDWIFPLRKAGAADHTSRLLVLPYAAAGASSLRPLLTELPDTVDLLGVSLPGRERRFGEPPTTDFTELVDGVLAELATREPLPTHLLGHSMGASLALALAQALPGGCAGVAVSGRKPEGVALAPVLAMDDRQITDFLTAAGNTSPQLLNDEYWRNHLIQLFRSDTELDVRTSEFLDGKRLGTRILALGGQDDPYVEPADLAAWQRHTDGPCEVRLFPGHHFFLLDPGNRAAVAATLAAFVADVPAGTLQPA